ncbi:hypothetical protein EIN_480620 [Entamoeba invadens IP1]|uniref:Uncharacterized protein n=1 Tax=Entamoeba invadens IP1 TaxID=370355 RepID=L7FN61_ENTIV|nr:hypothetical protein EIN_480620 [Entamoeba invadens IP1]ELP91153.1 hypothetical protein EIN_480620 [Entamoeba invadens IP1]|eukprot:XP_004257924.1 hypothetical protein EIN_480620 [Entamoeba invadens IP1]
MSFDVTHLLIFMFIFMSVSSLFILLDLNPNSTRFKVLKNTNKQVTIPRVTLPTYSDQILDTTHFNYNGACSKVFKYLPNNKRDLWLSAIGINSQKYYEQIMKDVPLVFGLSNSSIPNADKVLLFLPGYNYTELSTMAQSYGFQTVEIDLPNIKKCQDASKRFFAFKEYLEDKLQLYDRVLISDFRDVYIFADFFATFSAQDLVFTPECSYDHEECVTLNQVDVKNWMANGYGKDMAETYAKNNSLLMNVGTIFGGTKKVFNYITLMTENLSPEKYKDWGYDQAVHNVIFYTYYFNKNYIYYNDTNQIEFGEDNGREEDIIDMKKYQLDRCSQRFCFREKNTCIYDKQKKIVFTKNTMCAPVLRHKILANGLKLDWCGKPQKV